MKHYILLFAAFIIFFFSKNIQAQTIVVQHDSVVSYNPMGLVNVTDDIAASTGSVTVNWKVIDSDFPSDWLALLAICDNNLCYNNSPTPALWPNKALHTSAPYETFGDFHVQIDLSTATSTGCHYVKVRLYNTSIASDSNKVETYIICKSPLVVPVAASIEDKVALYPNPANNEVNVVYDANADVKNIAVYNIIGKMMTVYKVTGNSANLNIENIPSGIYFVRLFNSNGNVIATRKFIRQ